LIVERSNKAKRKRRPGSNVRTEARNRTSGTLKLPSKQPKERRPDSNVRTDVGNRTMWTKRLPT
jgi:hypothetical protein